MKVEQLKQHLSRACPTRLGTKPRAVFVFSSDGICDFCEA